ncbi:molybdopterin-dependent oxidoreductase [uncultured Ferrimonas sp.]|uniref:molybdopterin-dependent oxidoreductase n=1 Tax=uncultured Ferrimonas sp. TaxID=432640 RepID=UPI00262CB4D6|nr:molybdopterin-dependent oxidoreductase [uncultured Ferrimonas sp.]
MRIAIALIWGLWSVIAVAAPSLTITQGQQQWALSLAQLQQLPVTEITSPMPWQAEPSPQHYRGVRLLELQRHVGLSAIKQLKITALNGYQVMISAEELAQIDYLLAYQLNGRPISVREKGPLTLVADVSHLIDTEQSHLIDLNYDMVWFVSQIDLYE